MTDSYEHSHEIRALAMRVAALEDDVAFLEQWCEEQQDALDRTGGRVGCDYEVDRDPESEVTPRALLRVVDLRDTAGCDGGADGEEPIFAVVENEHERRVRQIRVQLNRLRVRLAASLAPRPTSPVQRRAERLPVRPVSAKPAGRTAP